MKNTLIHGLAAAVLAAAMSGNAAAQLAGPPTVACTSANYGQFHTVEQRPPGSTQTTYWTYLCEEPGYWTLWSRCGGFGGCIYY